MTLYQQIHDVLVAEQSVDYAVIPYGYTPSDPSVMVRPAGIVDGRRIVDVICAVPYQLADPELALASLTDTAYDILRHLLVDLSVTRMPDYQVRRRSRAGDHQGYPAMIISGAGRNAGIGGAS